MSKSFLVESSARHVHLTKEALNILFGEGATLKPKKYLSQPGQFACEQRVNIVGPKSTIMNVSILGPERNSIQIEISATDARKLGINAPIKESGDLDESGGCKLVGPNGEIDISKGVIVAKRHLHATPEDAENLGVKNGDIVWVRVDGIERNIIFGDVIVRVSPNYSLSMHIDTDEANAANCGLSSRGYIINIK